MPSNCFVVDDLVDLLALQRVFREAKFCAEPDDFEVSDSPIVQKLFMRLIDVIVSVETERDGEGARDKWNAWLRIDPSRDEWNAALLRARRESTWESLSESDRQAYVTRLFSPFVLSFEMMDKFIAAVDLHKT